jgi:CHAT domain-containing protein
MVASQWRIDSASTATLMINFHKLLKGTEGTKPLTKAEALRQAALNLKINPRYRHPFFWASFAIIGDGN